MFPANNAMTRSFICAACRAQTVLRPSPILVTTGRRNLSHAGIGRQNDTAAGTFDTLFERQDAAAPIASKPSGDGRTAAGHVGSQDGKPGKARLSPRELLSSLDTMKQVQEVRAGPSMKRRDFAAQRTDGKYISGTARRNFERQGQAQRAQRTRPHTRHEDGDTGLVDAGAAASPIQFAHEPANLDVRRMAVTSISRLRRALEKQDLHAVERVRDDVFRFAANRKDDPMIVPLEVYEHLMLNLLKLRSPQAAIAIWNHVVESGYTMTVKTYTVMMRGAQSSRDFRGMEAFWFKMRSEGILPDAHSWSIRVTGHIRQGHVKSGLQVLHEMGQEWTNAAKVQYKQEQGGGLSSSSTKMQPQLSELLERYPGPVSDAARPNLVVMNAAISALALVRDNAISDVLSWGRSFGVAPDRNTYNVLLNLSLRHGQLDEGLSLMRRMQSQGVGTDSTTWTVLLTALFQGGFLDGLDLQEQQVKILQLIKSLEGEGSGSDSMDEKAYALMIDRLLRMYGNPAAATAVLQHMVERGLKPTAHIYTILMTHHFQQESGPDFAAIERLWKHIRDQDSGYGAPLDNVFYDRMIENYALHHESQGLRPAIGFYKQMLQEGKKPGWRALRLLATAFQDRSAWDHLTALVASARERQRDGRGGTQHMGEAEFWEFAISTGALREEGITRPEQLTELRDARFRRSPLTTVSPQHAQKASAEREELDV